MKTMLFVQWFLAGCISIKLIDLAVLLISMKIEGKKAVKYAEEQGLTVTKCNVSKGSKFNIELEVSKSEKYS